MGNWRTHIASFSFLMLLLTNTAVRGQWYAGLDARILSDKKSLGGSFELGREFPFGWLFLQGAYINRHISYPQPAFNAWRLGTHGEEGAIAFPQRTEINGVPHAPGVYAAPTYMAYFPSGSEIVFSASYCFSPIQGIMLGPTVGIATQNQVPVEAALYPSAIYGQLVPGAITKAIWVGNIGGVVKFQIGKNDSTNSSTLLNLEYASQTGASIGVSFPIVVGAQSGHDRKTTFVGGGVRMLTDGKSLGGSLEFGAQYPFGWMFLEGTYVNGQLSYNQSRSFNYQFVPYNAYFPGGPDYFLSVSYCFELSRFLLIGPTIGLGLRTMTPVWTGTTGTELQSNNTEFGPPLAGNELNEFPKKLLLVGNVGGSLKIAFAGLPQTALLLLEYATESGAGLGIAVPF